MPENDEQQDDGHEPEGDTFPRAYVEQLRSEAAEHRTRANAAEQRVVDLRASILNTALRTAAAVRLQDPEDVSRLGDVARFLNDDDTVDTDGITAAMDDLLKAKPHLQKPRLTSGDGGPRGGTPPREVSWGQLLGGKS